MPELRINCKSCCRTKHVSKAYKNACISAAMIKRTTRLDFLLPCSTIWHSLFLSHNKIIKPSYDERSRLFASDASLYTLKCNDSVSSFWYLSDLIFDCFTYLTSLLNDRVIDPLSSFQCSSVFWANWLTWNMISRRVCVIHEMNALYERRSLKQASKGSTESLSIYWYWFK